MADPTCRGDGCNRTQYSRELCKEHYEMEYRRFPFTKTVTTQPQARRDGRNGRPRKGVPRHIRMAIYERDQWTCQLCMRPVDQTLPTNHRHAATLDHVICQSWTEVADHSFANLRLAHRSCNSARSDDRYVTTHTAAVTAAIMAGSSASSVSLAG